MGEFFSFSLAAPIVAAIALAALAVVCTIVARRAIELPISSRVLGALGLAVWCLALGGVSWL
ncbi:MAG TPA: hypothetical protein VFW23_04820, partial [Tepidisphaeraceae bacterium]|nr:hypothetical protein [Tepidisphaeraceae bacterium]